MNQIFKILIILTFLITVTSLSRGFVNEDGRLNSYSQSKQKRGVATYISEYYGQKDNCVLVTGKSDCLAYKDESSKVLVSNSIIIKEDRNTVIKSKEAEIKEEEVIVNAWIEDDNGNKSDIECKWIENTYTCKF